MTSLLANILWCVSGNGDSKHNESILYQAFCQSWAQIPPDSKSFWVLTHAYVWSILFSPDVLCSPGLQCKCMWSVRPSNLSCHWESPALFFLKEAHRKAGDSFCLAALGQIIHSPECPYLSCCGYTVPQPLQAVHPDAKLTRSLSCFKFFHNSPHLSRSNSKPWVSEARHFLSWF